jgi:hypothetical protein
VSAGSFHNLGDGVPLSPERVRIAARRRSVAECQGAAPAGAAATVAAETAFTTRTPTAETWKRLRSEPLPFSPWAPRCPEERCSGPSQPAARKTSGHSPTAGELRLARSVLYGQVLRSTVVTGVTTICAAPRAVRFPPGSGPLKGVPVVEGDRRDPVPRGRVREADRLRTPDRHSRVW